MHLRKKVHLLITIYVLHCAMYIKNLTLTLFAEFSVWAEKLEEELLSSEESFRSRLDPLCFSGRPFRLGAIREQHLKHNYIPYFNILYNFSYSIIAK